MLLWGLSFVASKEVLNTGIPPMTMVCMRFVLTTVVLNVLLRIKEPKTRVGRGNVLPLLASGLVGVTIYFIFESRGIKLTSASHASLIIASIPIFTVLAEWIFFRTRVGWAAVLGILLSVAGVVFVVRTPGAPLFSGSFTGDLFMFGACFSWVAYILLSKNLHTRMSDLAITTYQSVFGTAFLIPFALLEIRQWVPLTLPAVLALLYLALLSSAAGNFFYVYALSHLGPITISPYLNLIPVIGALGGVAILGERVTLFQALGGVVIIAGVLIVNWRQRPSRGSTAPGAPVSP
jgi:drug/metabolite transporter (DMT)-like permease